MKKWSWSLLAVALGLSLPMTLAEGETNSGAATSNDLQRIVKRLDEDKALLENRLRELNARVAKLDETVGDRYRSASMTDSVSEQLKDIERRVERLERDLNRLESMLSQLENRR